MRPIIKRKTLLQFAQRRRLIGALVVVLVAVLGTYLLVTSRAQSPYATNEAETGTLAGGATIASNSTASGGKFVQFGSPSGWQASYFNNMTLTPPAVLTRTEQTIGFNTYETSVAPGVNADAWSAKYTSSQTFTAGSYVFTATVDDGIRMYVDGNIVLDHWLDEAATTYNSNPVTLTAGPHAIEVDYYNNAFAEVLSVSWAASTGGGGGGGGSGTYPTNTLNKLLYDVAGPHEESPHGTCSSYSFYQYPEIDSVWSPNYTAVTPWGVVYEGINGNTATNVRVEVRNLQLWGWSNSQQKWSQLVSTPFLNFAGEADGGMFSESGCGVFTNTSHSVQNYRTESDGGASVVMESGYWLHIWMDGTRPTINPSDLSPVLTTFEARIVKDNATGPDNTASADYVASAGADWYLNPGASWPDNAQVFYGRFEKVTNYWKAFSGWPGGVWGCGGGACNNGSQRFQSTTDYNGNTLYTNAWLQGHQPPLPNFSETTTGLPYPNYPN